eukprot:768606-Hanusia_phi.AAC.6
MHQAGRSEGEEETEAEAEQAMVKKDWSAVRPKILISHRHAVLLRKSLLMPVKPLRKWPKSDIADAERSR